jgi:hypothetical protein
MFRFSFIINLCFFLFFFTFPQVPLPHFAAAQALGTILWMFRKVGSLVGRNVAVIGQGPNGLLATHLASMFCAKSVIGWCLRLGPAATSLCLSVSLSLSFSLSLFLSLSLSLCISV